MGYSDLQLVKRRLNFADTQKALDPKINGYMVEADNYVNTQIGLHATVPIANPDDELVSLASSLAAATFNYWNTPAKDRTMDGISKFEKRIQDHILAKYSKKNPTGLTASTWGKAGSGMDGTEG